MTAENGYICTYILHVHVEIEIRIYMYMYNYVQRRVKSSGLVPGEISSRPNRVGEGRGGV